MGINGSYFPRARVISYTFSSLSHSPSRNRALCPSAGRAGATAAQEGGMGEREGGAGSGEGGTEDGEGGGGEVSGNCW